MSCMLYLWLQAYRLLAEEMYTKGWDYPLHLGVTEVRCRAAARVSDAKASSDVHPARWTRTPGRTSALPTAHLVVLLIGMHAEDG